MIKIKTDSHGLVSDSECPKLKKTCKCYKCDFFSEKNSGQGNFIYCSFPCKMTFFEAWEKAEEGDELSQAGSFFCKKEEFGELRYEHGKLISQRALFFKEWSIVPKKKTVTIEIPEKAKNVVVTFDGLTTIFPEKNKCSKANNVTYDINGDD